MSLISSVNIVTSLGAGRPGNGVWIPDNGQILFSPPRLWCTPKLTSSVYECFCVQTKRLEPKVTHSLPSIPKLVIAWSCIFTVPYAFVSWYLIMCCEFLASVVVLFL